MKFRVWDKKEKRFIDWLYIDTKGRLLEPNYDYDIYPVEDPDRYVVQTCIGMKDKDGQEIYVGDIVKGTWMEKDHLKQGRLLIQEEEGCYPPFTEPTGASSGYFYSTICRSEDFKVIGNEFENPELEEEV